MSSRKLEVILTEGVDGLGKAGDVVNVALGFAKNRLFNGQAVPKNKENLRRIESIRIRADKVLAKQKEDADATAKTLHEMVFSFEKKVHDQNKLYGSVSQNEVLEKIRKETGIEFDKHKLIMHDHIKEIGEFPFAIRLHPEVTIEIKVVVKGLSES